MSLKQFMAAAHVAVRPEGRAHLFEEFLAERKLNRRVLLEISHFMSLLPIVDNSDLVATVPRDLAEVCSRYADIRIVAPPMKLPVIEVHQFWHRRFHKDAANIWLRGVVHALFKAD